MQKSNIIQQMTIFVYLLFKRVSPLLMLGIFPRRDANDPLKRSNKVCIVAKAYVFSGLLNRGSFSEQQARLTHPIVDDVSTHAETGGSLEQAAQIVLADKEFAADLIQRDFFTVIVVDVIDDGHDFQKFP